MTRRLRLFVFALTLCLAAPALHAQTPVDASIPARTPVPASDPQAEAHRAKGKDLLANSDYTKALAEYQRAYHLDKIAHLQYSALDLVSIGLTYYRSGQLLKSLDALHQALAVCRKLGDKSGDAEILKFIDIVSSKMHPPDPQAAAHRAHGQALSAKYDYAGAIAEYLKAYALDKTSHLEDATLDLNKIGRCYDNISQYPEALIVYQQEVTLERQIGDKSGQAVTLSNIGLAYRNLSQYSKALDYYEQALSIQQQIGDMSGEGTTLNNIGATYGGLSQYSQALDYFKQALPVAQQIGNKSGEATALSNIGLAYRNLSQYSKALDYYEQALPIRRAVGDKVGEATTLNNIGAAYALLSQYSKALGYFEQALPIAQLIEDKSLEATTLGNIGATYNHLSQYSKALDYHEQALPIEQQIGDKAGEAVTLDNIGTSYNELSQYSKALDYYEQSLPIRRAIRDKSGEATTLNNIGLAYDYLSQYSKALDYYEQALPIDRAVGDESGEAKTLNNIMLTWNAIKRPSVAVFYGKQAVNVFQAIRANLSALDQASQKTYLEANAGTYRTLANLLIQQGRIPEAEAILALLKDAEYKAFNATDRAVVEQAAAPVPLTDDEAKWQADYAALGDTLEDLNQQATDLAKINPRTPAQETQYKALTKKLDTADAAFQGFLDRLAKHFTDSAKSNAAVATVAGSAKMQDLLGAWAKTGTRVAAIYTVEADSQYAVILVTPNASRPGVTTISAADLNTKIEAFRQALENPNADPRPLGRELYKILVGPIEKDLVAYKPQVVMWSLDGQIRYLPVAALYDGKQYLVERWQNTLFDPSSLTDLDHARSDWTQAQALGLGVSKAHRVKTLTQDDEFPALTNVPQEIDGIIHDPSVAGASGVLPGQVEMDAAFTDDSMKDALRGHTHPLVHIATHFRFDAARAEQSYLLLGDGGQLSLADLRRPGLFRGVDLLTLSACSTAMGQANADGKEVDGLGRTAEDDGAQAVIASLWSVSDASTAQLMQTLYRDLQRNPSLTKAAALQAAQVSLLRGGASAPGTTTRATMPVSAAPSASDAPPFVPDPKAPYAHPFYWAPFILIGNWQ